MPQFPRLRLTIRPVTIRIPAMWFRVGVAAYALAIVGVASGFGWQLTRVTAIQRGLPAKAEIAAFREDLTSGGRIDPLSDRPVFPFSVIPGGVRSQQEVAAAVSRDSVVAAHYREIGVGAVMAQTVKEDRLAYMSYRKNNKIYWTKRPLLLRAGETVLTDGVNQIRARCGNCIAAQPLGPTSDEEPTAAQFDALTLGPGDGARPSDLAGPNGYGGTSALGTAGDPSGVGGAYPGGSGSFGGLGTGGGGTTPPGETTPPGDVPPLTPPLGPPPPPPPGPPINPPTDPPTDPPSGPPPVGPPPIVPPPVGPPPVVPPPEGPPEGPPPEVPPSYPPVIIKDPRVTEGPLPVPEPGSWVLVGTGVGAWLLSRARSKRR